MKLRLKTNAGSQGALNRKHLSLSLSRTLAESNYGEWRASEVAQIVLFDTHDRQLGPLMARRPLPPG